MSRLGKSPIDLPKNSKLKVSDGKFLSKGPKATYMSQLTQGLKYTVEEGRLVVEFDEKVEISKRTVWPLSRNDQ